MMSDESAGAENDLLEQFDAKWQSGEVTEIKDFLLAADHKTEGGPTRDLLFELVMLDLEYRWRRATRGPHLTLPARVAHRSATRQGLPDRPVLEDYVDRYPELGCLDDLPVDFVADEYRVRQRWGDHPRRDEYPARFPGRGEALAAALDHMDELLASQAQSSGLRTRCPHCRESILLSNDAELTEICCPCCGSDFSIVSDDAVAGEIASIAHFELIERLGSGSFGKVWKARDTQLDRVVAVKIPRRGHLDASEVEQFLREARAAAQLNHPNIASVHEVGRDGLAVYIVSDLVQGDPLGDWLAGHQMTFRAAA